MHSIARTGLASLEGWSSVDPGVKIDDNIDGSHENFGCDENNNCGRVKSQQSCESSRYNRNRVFELGERSTGI